MPSPATFTIKPIKSLLNRYVESGEGWIDPFAGNNSPAEYTNDLNPKTEAANHMHALEFVKKMRMVFKNPVFKGILFDPPYSGRQVRENYSEIGKEVHTDDTNSYFYSSVKKAISPLLRPGGYAICFGWNSNGFGGYLGFELIEVLLVAHGAHHNDTIVTVERKVNGVLQ